MNVSMKITRAMNFMEPLGVDPDRLYPHIFECLMVYVVHTNRNFATHLYVSNANYAEAITTVGPPIMNSPNSENLCIMNILLCTN